LDARNPSAFPDNERERVLNPDVFIAAIGDVAKARGMAQIAKDAGLGRESLYKALSAGAHPRYETINAVLRALGVKFAVVADQQKPR
jgi:probable addiction module antidote protein